MTGRYGILTMRQFLLFRDMLARVFLRQYDYDKTYYIASTLSIEAKFIVSRQSNNTTMRLRVFIKHPNETQLLGCL